MSSAHDASVRPAARIPKQVWEANKERILELYERKTLEETIAIMAAAGFVAT